MQTTPNTGSHTRASLQVGVLCQFAHLVVEFFLFFGEKNNSASFTCLQCTRNSIVVLFRTNILILAKHIHSFVLDKTLLT